MKQPGISSRDESMQKEKKLHELISEKEFKKEREFINFLETQIFQELVLKFNKDNLTS